MCPFCPILPYIHFTRKVIVFTMNRDSLVELHETLGKNFRNDLENQEYQTVLLSPIAEFDRPTLYLTLSTLGAVAMYNVNSIIAIIIQLSHGNEIIKHRTPFPSKYPFPESNGLYVTRYLIEVWASCAVISISSATDALFDFYIFQMASQLRVLSYRMSKLTAFDDHQRIIKECVVRQQCLTRCHDKLQTIYGPIVLWILTTSAMTMCANIFQAFQISMDKVVLVFIYITMKLMQTLLYGWFGSFLTSESEQFRNSIYACGWPGSGDALFVFNIKTMLLCRPLVLKAWQFYAISVDMFMAIMNTTLSYFFLLRTLDEN
ncbi:odorant receptor 4-like [Venturia canescens]|uniref:odorant receptor 4-like n=1 Tax=Venturia canescens TaxID=32260 RepID=UPI001C9BC8ED|nr:odorant receptor 4-like [Venturia canescens]